ncbi:hypothetical protein HY230_07685 [Candidatus Acetothermia bacterium]|nr:hypothetical protein [Candidatus Acetothermia bacterium]
MIGNQPLIILLLLALLAALGVPVAVHYYSSPPPPSDPVIVEQLQFENQDAFPPLVVVHGMVYVTRYCSRLDLTLGLYDSVGYEVSRANFSTLYRQPGEFGFVATGPAAWTAVRAQLLQALCY